MIAQTHSASVFTLANERKNKNPPAHSFLYTNSFSFTTLTIHPRNNGREEGKVSP